MGGLACMVERNAILKFQTVPTDPTQLDAFDAQVRMAYGNPDIAQTVVNQNVTADTIAACKILAKDSFTMADRTNLLYILNALYSYPSGY